MNGRVEIYGDVAGFLRRLNSGYLLKKKRLRFMRLASVNSEILMLRESFGRIWRREGENYLLAGHGLSVRSREILTGIFGKHNEAEEILAVNREILSFNGKRFREFLDERIGSINSRKNLYGIIFGESGSLREAVSRQAAYIEKVLPLLVKIDRNRFTGLRISEGEYLLIEDFILSYDVITENLAGDIRLYRRFMKDFRRLYSESAGLEIIGYGEISTVMEIGKGNHLGENCDSVRDPGSEWIWKKMPPFSELEEVESYQLLYMRYRELLLESLGIPVPEQTVYYFRHRKHYIVYAGQKKADPRRVCHRLLRDLDEENALKIFRQVLDAVGRVHEFNRGNRGTLIGFDAQLSNWVHQPEESNREEVFPGDRLIYLDTSSPLIRENGVEQLNTEIFLMSAASFLRPVIRKFFLREVLDRYYEMRSVTVDLIANLYKEKRRDLIDPFIGEANRFFREWSISEKEITRREIDKYYSGDAFIWKFYQSARRIDRFITEKIFRKRYTYRLPGKIER